MLQEQTVNYSADPNQLLTELQKSIRKEQGEQVASLQTELGRVKGQLTKAQKQLDKCATFLEISKKIDSRQNQSIEILMDDPNTVKLIETFAERFQKDSTFLVNFILTSLFHSDRGQQALAFLMSQFNG
jgi:hypothetical protein